MKLTTNLKILFFLVIASAMIEVSFSLKNSEVESAELKESINLNGGSLAFKHKKIRTSNQNQIKKSTTTTQSKEKSKNSATSKSKTNTKTETKSSNKQAINDDLMGANPDLLKQTNMLAAAYAANNSKMPGIKKKIDFEKMGPIAFHSWIKFFKYTDQVASVKDAKLRFNQNKKFFDNGEFREQLKYYPGEDYQQIDSDGEFKYVSNPQEFYLVAFKNQVVIFSSKMEEVNRRKAFESFSYADVRPVYEDDKKSGGVIDFGDFSEGSCAKIITRDSGKLVWIICFDTTKKKSTFIDLVRAIKIEEQHQDGLIVMKKKPQNKNTLAAIMKPKLPGSELKDGKVAFNSTTQKVTDGYWITIQNWSQCSLKCGGGTSTLQRMCVPPKAGGKECEGEAIVTKSCNTQPCPDVLSTGQKMDPNRKVTIKKPIMKSAPFSEKPQRYVKCKIKESDLFVFLNVSDRMFDSNPVFKRSEMKDQQTVEFPVRAVMNNQTVSVYTGDEIESLYLTFNIKLTSFHRSSKQGCFQLYESSKKYITLCPFGCDNGSTQGLEEWDYDFHLFKFQCANKRDDKDARELKRKLDEKINDAKNALMAEQADKIRRRTKKAEKEQMMSIVKKTNGIALQAIQKELNLEAMIQKEEEEKIEREKAEILANIEKERKKKECVLKSIRERELENQYNLHAMEAEKSIETIKRQTAQQVLIRRNALNSKLRLIRQRAEREKNKLKQQLQNVRASIADEIGNKYKKGDINKCLIAMENTKHRNDYCIAHFSDDLSDLQYCRDTSEFCNFCCDTEISEMYLKDRQLCYSKVCNALPLPKNRDLNDLSGKWVFEANPNKQLLLNQQNNQFNNAGI